MKNQRSTRKNGFESLATARLWSGRKPLLTRLRRLLWAAALLLPAFAAPAQVVFTNLYSFSTFPPNGENPNNGLVQGNDGYFYGTTQSGGANNAGTVFKLSTNGVLTTLYSFTGGSDGAYPEAALVQGRDGYFYGTTWGGGTNYFGTVFKISTSGVLTTLYSFTGGNDARGPRAQMVQGSDGFFYGTTVWGGNPNLNGGYGDGTVFKISTNGVLTIVHSFSGGNDSSGPNGLVLGSDGFFYGTTSVGGNTNLNNGYGFGTVFKISTNGALTNLYLFTGGNDGAFPTGTLVLGNDGYFYGSTTSGDGTVFKIGSNGVLTTLHAFTGGNDGSYPNGLVQGSDGNFYGTTGAGGNTNLNGGYGYGTVFKISTNGVLTTVHSFSGGNDGSGPDGLVLGSDGYFYGTAGVGPNGAGIVFKISTSGALTSLYLFTQSNEGTSPQAALVQGSDNYFYGTTSQGGTNGDGTVFKISINGVLAYLYSFTGSNDGANPQAALVQGTDGYFYGTTPGGGTNGYGTVFRIGTNGALTSLYLFGSVQDTNGDLLDGSGPSGLVQGSDGYFYGTTYGGGAYGLGTVFKLSANGMLNTLYSFTGGNDGGNPNTALVQGTDGYFYGGTAELIGYGYSALSGGKTLGSNKGIPGGPAIYY